MMDYFLNKKTMESCAKSIDRKTYRLKEEILARKRNEEYHKQLYWEDIQNYYKTLNLQTSKYNQWASQPQLPKNDEKEMEMKEDNLKRRREKLFRLLTEEQKQLEEELKKKNKDCIKSTLNEVLEEKEMEGSEVTQEFHSFLGIMKKKKCEFSTRKSWIQLMEEEQQQKECENQLLQKLEKDNERRRQLEMEKEFELSCKRREEAKQMKIYLLHLMQEVKKKDELTNQLQWLEEQELKLKSELEKIASCRSETLKRRKKNELHTMLHQQYQLHIRKCTREIQQLLKKDKQWLNEITHCLDQNLVECDPIWEGIRKEVNHANAKLSEYTQLEIQREQETEFMFFEEARRMWQKQEVQWKVEQEARNDLMTHVFVSIHNQVEENLGKNAEQHKALADEKEELLRHIEELNYQLKELELPVFKKTEEYKNESEQKLESREQKI